MPTSKTTTRPDHDADRHSPEVNPWVPMARPIDIKHVGKMIEELYELSEAAARAGKILARYLIQGADACDPSTGRRNSHALEEEIADVLANAELVIDQFKLDAALIEMRKQRKMTRLRQWHKMLP